MANPFTVFRAKTIITMSRNRPKATHVAVMDGKVLAVGDAADLEAWKGFWPDLTVDDRYADMTLMPGFVEAHGHAMEGSVWHDLFLGYFERHSPDGTKEGGLKTIDAVLERLKKADAALEDPTTPLIAWGYDPIYYDNARMTRQQLDTVSTTRPIVITHASFHIMNVNSKVLEEAGMFEETGVEGVLKDAHGDVTGELQEMAAMFMAMNATGAGMRLREIAAEDLYRFAQSGVNAGVTTCTDLHQKMDDAALAAYESATADPDFQMRIVPAFGSLMWDVPGGIQRVKMLKAKGNDKLHLGIVKVMTDGSIQGFTARLKWPGYHNGAPNGIWNNPPQQLKDLIKAYNAEGIQMHLHVNGDQASEFVIDCLEEALNENPHADHRHTLQHCQMADAAQFKKAGALGICANLFTNHIYYWGDQHYELTMGPDRANRMDACATALAHGVKLAIHCDVPVTPLGPLFTAWCAVNRLTATGRVLGEAEKISLDDALYAITLGAAWQLKLDHLVGSIEVGKFADFAVLDSDPYDVGGEKLKDIKVLGTVLSGRPQVSAIHGTPAELEPA